ncbi:uncharacterized protein LOC108226701 isoform X2 [Daucus carota subsp. sativus]|uniref:uncharacterized protein LOC108226701 isoform X2 n=1 Tax=Daucus carota subsp. sativus TaxID=79200 RepID=UPI0007EF85AD|nr:PREDICTED: uncharacterized protein LOC108226701 isoform X2 [Daucus carota subsp. sativus]
MNWQYGAMQTDRCFDNDVFIQLYHLTEISVAEGVDYIQRHVFNFTELSAIIDDTRENKFLIDVVGILQQRQPITSYRNKYNQLKHSIHFTINDMLGSANVIFYDEMAQAFDQGVRDATQHPIIVIISSAKPRFIQGWQIGISTDVLKSKDANEGLYYLKCLPTLQMLFLLVDHFIQLM